MSELVDASTWQYAVIARNLVANSSCSHLPTRKLCALLSRRSALSRWVTALATRPSQTLTVAYQ
jgi:hypothetical protein